MIIDLPPQLERVIMAQAQMQGISVSELIAQKFNVPQYPKGDIQLDVAEMNFGI